jgi:hypothetical protein
MWPVLWPARVAFAVFAVAMLGWVTVSLRALFVSQVALSMARGAAPTGHVHVMTARPETCEFTRGERARAMAAPQGVLVARKMVRTGMAVEHRPFRDTIRPVMVPSGKRRRRTWMAIEPADPGATARGPSVSGEVAERARPATAIDMEAWAAMTMHCAVPRPVCLALTLAYRLAVKLSGMGPRRRMRAGPRNGCVAIVPRQAHEMPLSGACFLGVAVRVEYHQVVADPLRIVAGESGLMARPARRVLSSAMCLAVYLDCVGAPRVTNASQLEHFFVGAESGRRVGRLAAERFNQTIPGQRPRVRGRRFGIHGGNRA